MQDISYSELWYFILSMPQDDLIQIYNTLYTLDERIRVIFDSFFAFGGD